MSPTQTESTASASAPAKPRLLAIIVGVDDYDHLPELHGASRDAQLVFDALRRTRQSKTEVVPKLLISRHEPGPRREAVLECLRGVASEAQERDTVLVYLAGHGVISGGRMAFVPSDGDPADPGSLLPIDELQHFFDDSACPQRALFLDMCQEAVGAAEDTRPAADADAPRSTGSPSRHPDRTDALQNAATRGVPRYRARGRVSSAFLDGLRLTTRGWTILTSCGPGQLSLESDDLEGHGIFSYYLALGLRGEGDLDGDGTVGLGELAQYVSNMVPAEARLASSGFLEQVPEVFCRGQIAAFTDEGAATGDALATDRRVLKMPPGLFRAWFRALRGHWPFEGVTGWTWIVRGTALVYALLMGLEVLLLFRTYPAGVWATAGGVGLVSGLLWYGVVCLSIPVATLRFHHGGYFGAAAMVLWHAVLFLALASLADTTTQVIRFGAWMFLILCLMIAFGINPFHIVVSLLDLERRKEEGDLRDFFRDFEDKLMRVEFTNTAPCESLHPKIYLGVWVIFTVPLLVHMVSTVWGDRLDAADGIAFLRDAALWVLATWFVSGYHAVYRALLRRHPKRVRT